MQVIPFPAERRAAMAAPARITTLVPAWCAARRADGCRPCGVDAYADKLRQFVVYAGDIPPAAVDVDLVDAYKVALSDRGLANSTVRHSLTVLRAFLTWCVAKGHATENAALAVRHPKVAPPDPDPLTREQLGQLLAALDRRPQSHRSTWRRNRRAVGLMLYAGLRIAEAAGIERRDLDLDRREITVRKDVAKGGRPRVVPICDELAAELESVRAYRPEWRVVDQGDHPTKRGTKIEVKSLAHLFERHLPRKLGFPIHAHQLRKTFATELYVRGEDIATIQRLLGHQDPKTTMRYIGASAEKERAAVQKLRFREQQKTDA